VTNIFVANSEDLTDEDIQTFGSETLDGCPAYAQLDLSDKGTNLLERREKIVASLTLIGRIAIVSAAVMLLAAGGLYFNLSNLLEAGTSSMGEIYKSAFREKESSAQPLSSALSKLRSLRNPDVDVSFNLVMRGVTSVWDDLGASGDISIDTLRYGAENTDAVGLAKSNESIQRLRSALEAEGFVSKIDNIQQIPGGDLRFNLAITKGGR
jgi:hypothetical protein